MSLINRETLYEKACDLEAQALAHVGKIVNDETKIEEWKIWSAILVERTAFKHDIFDAPSAQPSFIYCKDCKHWMPYDWMFSEIWQSQNMDDYPEDEIGCAYCDMNMSANDFCSRGERRTDG